MVNVWTLKDCILSVKLHLHHSILLVCFWLVFLNKVIYSSCTTIASKLQQTLLVFANSVWVGLELFRFSMPKIILFSCCLGSTELEVGFLNI